MILDVFDAYYEIAATKDGKPILFGAVREHFVQVAPNVYLIRMAKDYLDTDFTGSIMCDFDLGSADPTAQPFAMELLSGGSPDFSLIHPVAAFLVGQDLADGLAPEDIVEKRAAVLVSEFLGFSPEHVALVKPELFEEPSVWTGGIIA